MNPSLSPFPGPLPPRSSDGSGLALVAGSAACLLAALQLGISRGVPAHAVESLLAISPPSWHAALEELKHGFYPDVNPDDRPTLAFLILQALTWIGMAGTAWHLLRRPASPRVLMILLVFAVFLRIILLPSVPVHDATASRGLWEGTAMISGVNPFRYEPGALTAHDLGLQEPTWIDGAVYRGRPWTAEDASRLSVLRTLRDAAPEDFGALPDPHLPTSSGALVQVLFGISSTLFGNSLLAWKSIVVAFDLGSIVLLLRLLRRLGYHRSGVIVYAWSPLVLTEFANAGRPDAIPIFFILLAISLYLPGRPIAAAAVLGAAALANLLALALAPVLFRSARRPLAGSLVLVAILAGGLTPFARWQDAGLGPLLRGINPWAGSAPGSGVPLGGAFRLTEALVRSIPSLAATSSAKRNPPPHRDGSPREGGLRAQPVPSLLLLDAPPPPTLPAGTAGLVGVTSLAQVASLAPRAPVFGAGGSRFTVTTASSSHSSQPDLPARLILAAFSALLLAWHGFRPATEARQQFLGAFRVLGALFVLSPDAEPWRLAWVLPFLAAFPRPSWFVLMLSVQAWFLQFPTDLRAPFGPISALPGLAALIWLPFLCFRFLDSRLSRQAIATTKSAATR